jgi:hypothetical protein
MTLPVFQGNKGQTVSIELTMNLHAMMNDKNTNKQAKGKQPQSGKKNAKMSTSGRGSNIRLDNKPGVSGAAKVDGRNGSSGPRTRAAKNQKAVAQSVSEGTALAQALSDVRSDAARKIKAIVLEEELARVESLATLAPERVQLALNEDALECAKTTIAQETRSSLLQLENELGIEVATQAWLDDAVASRIRSATKVLDAKVEYHKVSKIEAGLDNVNPIATEEERLNAETNLSKARLDNKRALRSEVEYEQTQNPKNTMTGANWNVHTFDTLYDVDFRTPSVCGTKRKYSVGSLLHFYDLVGFDDLCPSAAYFLPEMLAHSIHLCFLDPQNYDPLHESQQQFKEQCRDEIDRHFSSAFDTAATIAGLGLFASLSLNRLATTAFTGLKESAFRCWDKLAHLDTLELRALAISSCNVPGDDRPLLDRVKVRSNTQYTQYVPFVLAKFSNEMFPRLITNPLQVGLPDWSKTVFTTAISSIEATTFRPLLVNASLVNELINRKTLSVADRAAALERVYRLSEASEAHQEALVNMLDTGQSSYRDTIRLAATLVGQKPPDGDF